MYDDGQRSKSKDDSERKEDPLLIITPSNSNESTKKWKLSSNKSCGFAASGKINNWCAVTNVFLAVLVGCTVGILVGERLGRRAAVAGQVGAVYAEQYDWGDQVVINGARYDVADVFSARLNTSDIRDYLYNLTFLPHLAGSDVNRDLAMGIYNEWKDFGFDEVDVFNYTTLLSYPDKDKPNSLCLRSSGGTVLYESKIAEEPPLTNDEKKPNVAPPFNAYSGNGRVTGPLVYVNYGSRDDFMYLTNGTVLHLDLSHYICIVRYGQSFRGDQAHLAETYGCRGLLIFSDPENVAPVGIPVYPNGPSLPEFGVERGTLLTMQGDPLTPGIPAIPGMYRRPYDEVLSEHSAPSIPVQPVSYGDIIHFMRQLSQHTPPTSWQGGLSLDYKIAQAVDNDNVTELVVNVFQTSKMIHNVVAKLYGSVAPDRQVVIGNHRDAWVFGAADPNSGTAVLKGLAKVIGYLRGNGAWRPGRTLVLCSWDAEEYGLVGSTEWVEDFGKLLGASTVAYLNVDIAVEGSHFAPTSASPLLYEPVWQAAKAVQSPNQGQPTLYAEWLRVSHKNYNGTVKPRIRFLGGSSDYTTFGQTQGISCSNMIYKDKVETYAVYHSVHDNFNWMVNFEDATFTHHRALGLLWINTALSLATSPVLPGKATDYGFIMEEIFYDLDRQYGEVLDRHGVTLDYLGGAVGDFISACQDYQLERDHLISSIPDLAQHINLLRIINDKLMNVERAFIHPEGLPGQTYSKHVIFGLNSGNQYASSTFPGIIDAIFNALNAPGNSGSWNKVKRQIDIVRMHLRHATQILKQPTLRYAPKN